MPRLADTTLRLLGQEPLAGRLSVSEQLRLARALDRAGFAYLEISGGGCFQAAVKRGVESPWERIRALRAQTSSPVALALRGRFLVGARPAGGDLVRRFVACAAESGIDVFRLHDPLNDVDSLAEAAAAIAAAGAELDCGLVYSPGPGGSEDDLVDRARRVPELGAARVLVLDPSGALDPGRAGDLVAAVADASGLPVGVYCQGAGGAALATAVEAARAGADLIACAIYPLALALHRVPGESAASALAGLGLDTGVETDPLWEASTLVAEHLGDPGVFPLDPRVAARAAERRLPAGLVAALDAQLRANGAPDRLDEVLDELERVRRELGSPPLASPVGQILGSQALVHVLSQTRYQTVVDEVRALVAGRLGRVPGTIDPAVRRAIELVAGDLAPEEELGLDLEEARRRAQGLASSEEDLCLLALFGEEAEPLLRAIRSRARLEPEPAPAAPAAGERIREIVRIVEESGVQEVTIEEAGVKVTVRRSEERPLPPAEPAARPSLEEAAELAPAQPPSPDSRLVRVEAPMVGTFYRSPEPGAPPFVEEGDVVVPGQTLCILEAMKLMNEVKAEVEGIVRRIHAENAQPVEYGQLLFELELVDGRPPLV